MIPIPRVPEPPEFDAQVRIPGRRWLAAHPDAERPYNLWGPYRAALASGVQYLCAYSAMYEPVGTVDHFESYKKNRHAAYEWSNYRFASQWINSSKKTDDILDPCTMGEGWFEIQLPSLQLVLSDRVPDEYRLLAQKTLKRLPIAHDERIMKQRTAWYELYQNGELTLSGLRKRAPLIAAAEERRLSSQFHPNTDR